MGSFTMFTIQLVRYFSLVLEMCRRMSKICVQISLQDFAAIEKEVNRIMRAHQPFERIEVTKRDVLELFSYNKFKTEIIKELTGDLVSIYRCGTLVDLCTGPHIKHTGRIKAFKVTNVRMNNISESVRL